MIHSRRMSAGGTLLYGSAEGRLRAETSDYFVAKVDTNTVEFVAGRVEDMNCNWVS